MVEKTIPAKMVDAIRDQNVEEIQKLLSENPDQVGFLTPIAGQSWLGYAAQIGKLLSVEALIKGGIDVNLGNKHDNYMPICSAASNGHYDVVKYLLNSGSILDVSYSVRNPLFSAIVGRSPSIVKLLLESGIDSKVIYNSTTMEDMDAVAFALMQGERECAEIIALWNAGDDKLMAEEMLKEALVVAKRNV